jgi:hypothetical protein
VFFSPALLTAPSSLWAFESRQLLASFDVAFPITLLLSLNLRQLAYTALNDAKIRICNIPANIIANIEGVCFPAYSIIYMLLFLQTSKSEHPDILNVRDPALSFLHTIPFFICNIAAFAKFYLT